MDTTRFRPADTSSSAIREALTSATAALQDVKAQLDNVRQARDGLLIDGTPKERNAAQVKLVDARDVVEQLEAVRDQLRGRLDAALREETIGVIAARLEAIDGANARANEFWQTRGPMLVELLQESTAIANAISTNRSLLQNARMRAFERYPDDGDRIAQAPASITRLTDGASEWASAIRNASAPQ